MFLKPYVLSTEEKFRSNEINLSNLPIYLGDQNILKTNHKALSAYFPTIFCHFLFFCLILSILKAGQSISLLLEKVLYEGNDFHLLWLSGFANGESSGTELPVSVIHFSIYQGLVRKKTATKLRR